MDEDVFAEALLSVAQQLAEGNGRPLTDHWRRRLGAAAVNVKPKFHRRS